MSTKSYECFTSNATATSENEDYFVFYVWMFVGLENTTNTGASS